MALQGEYEPSPSRFAANQVELYERTKGAEGNTLLDTGMPVVIVTHRGRTSGKLRKTPLMRVEHEGQYLLVASKGGAPEHPSWYGNLVADPVVDIQDGPMPLEYSVRELDGAERELWWRRAVEAFPSYADYATQTERLIPLMLATRLGV